MSPKQIHMKGVKDKKLNSQSSTHGPGKIEETTCTPQERVPSPRNAG